jgi:hypothetical protein
MNLISGVPVNGMHLLSIKKTGHPKITLIMEHCRGRFLILFENEFYGLPNIMAT